MSSLLIPSPSLGLYARLLPCVYFEEDFVLSSEETLLKTVRLEVTLEGQWTIHHPNDLSLPQSYSKVSCQSPCALRKSAFAFCIPSLFTSYLCGCPKVSEKVMLCLDLSQLNSTLFLSTPVRIWSHKVNDDPLMDRLSGHICRVGA